MSQPQTIQIPQYVPDPYLLAAAMPQQDLTPDPQFHNIRMVTPIGRMFYVHVDKPHAIKQNNSNLPANPKFTATIGMNPAVTADIYRAICAVADIHWPAIQRVDPANPGNIVVVKGSAMLGLPENQGGFHYPLRSGDEAFAASTKPLSFAHWRGLFFINTSMNPRTKGGADQRPICLDELGNPTDPTRFYPGCYGRLRVTVAPFTNSGNNGVTFFLDAIQFARHGEPIKGSFDGEGSARSAFAAAGALPVAEPVNPAAFGQHSGGPGSVPPGMPGFAAPPPPSAGAPAGAPSASPQQFAPAGAPSASPQGQFAPTAPVPPAAAQPWTAAVPAQPAGGGMARPPGV